jgi:hypothetical protein
MVTMTIRFVLALCAAISGLAQISQGQNSVLMSQYDKERTGANRQEKVLTPANVNAKTFGKLFSRSVDGTVYALPLIAANVDLGKPPRRNLLFVCTMANTVYAFDAGDAAQAEPYWKKTLGTPSKGDSWIGPLTHGILSTPYVDLPTNTIYVVAKTQVADGDIGLFIHALDIRNGEHKYGSPVRMSFPHSEGIKTHVPEGIQRAGLLVDRGILYIGVAAIVFDPKEFKSQEGYVQAFNASNLAERTGNYQSTPTGLKGGIWQGGRGLAAGPGGDLFVAAAAGQYDGKVNFGATYIRLKSRTLELVDWFTPANHEFLFANNLDPSANGMTLLPGRGLVFGGGKEGIIYLLDQKKMGKLESTESEPLQKFPASKGCGQTDCAQTQGTVFWDLGGDGRLYVWDRGDQLRAYTFDGKTQRFATTPSSVSDVPILMTGGPAVSSNGNNLDSGIVWGVTVTQNANGTQVPGTLRAFRAADVSQEIYNSDQNAARDAVGNFTKFAPPVIANGKVYVPTHSNAVQVYGLLP